MNPQASRKDRFRTNYQHNHRDRRAAGRSRSYPRKGVLQGHIQSAVWSSPHIISFIQMIQQTQRYLQIDYLSAQSPKERYYSRLRKELCPNNYQRHLNPESVTTTQKLLQKGQHPLLLNTMNRSGLIHWRLDETRETNLSNYAHIIQITICAIKKSVE